MSASDVPMNARVIGLRDAFDRSFAVAPSSGAAAVERLLAIRAGTDRYALRLAEISGLFAEKKVTWLPSPVPELLGIAGFRGTVLPVYDLGMLLGCPRAAASRWLVVTAAMPVGLAFGGFDRYLSVGAEAIVPDARPEARQQHVRELVQADDLVRPVISLASVLAWIRHRASQDGLEKEQ
jgi:chemotaxis signal transduction protein